MPPPTFEARPLAFEGRQRPTTARHHRALAAIVALALGLRVGFIFYLDPDRIYFSDTVQYLAAASGLLAGEGFGASYVRPPLYPIMLSGILALFPDNLLALKLMEALVGSAAVLLTYALGRRIWGRDVAICGAAFVAVHPYLVILPAFLYSETLFTVFLLACLWSLLLVRDARGGLAAGALAGTAALTTASGLVLPPVGAAWLLAFGPGSVARRCAVTAVFLLGAGLLISTWVGRNYIVFGRLTLVDARAEVQLSESPADRFMTRAKLLGRAKVESDSRGPESPPAFHRSPGEQAAFIARQFLQFWSPAPQPLATAKPELRQRVARQDPRMVVEDHPAESVSRFRVLLWAALLPYYLFALMGVWAGRRRFKQASLLLSVTLGFALGYAIFFARLRYRLPLEPLIALFAAVGLRGPLGWSGARLQARHGRPTALGSRVARQSVQVAASEPPSNLGD